MQTIRALYNVSSNNKIKNNITANNNVNKVTKMNIKEIQVKN